MSGHEPCLRTENDDRGDGQVGPSGRTRMDWLHLWYPDPPRRTRFEEVMDANDWQIQQRRDDFQRETACRQALDRINLGLHTSEDVALLRRELNL